jgi:hypothetical protein
MNSPYFMTTLAQARVDDLRRAAAAPSRPRRRHAQRPPAQEHVTLRFGGPDDARQLARLAALDSARPLDLPVLLAEVNGQLLAALALSDGSVVADPFHPTEDLIELLRARARHLGGNADVERRGRVRRSWSRLRAAA